MSHAPNRRCNEDTYALLESNELFLSVDEVKNERVGARENPVDSSKKAERRKVSALTIRLGDSPLDKESGAYKLRKRVKPVRYMLRWL